MSACSCGSTSCDGRCRSSSIGYDVVEGMAVSPQSGLARLFDEGSVSLGSVRVGRCECGDDDCDRRCESRRFCKVRFCARRCSMRCSSHCSLHCSSACRERVEFYNSGDDDCGIYRPPSDDTCGQCHGNCDNCDCDVSSSRDDRALVSSCARGAGIARHAPTHSGGAYAWGGAISRVSEVTLAPSRDDESVSIHGSHIPIGFAKYKPLGLKISDYHYRRAGQWRVAVRQAWSGPYVDSLIARIMKHGPQAAGYVRMGDTLVPDYFEPSDRAALAWSARPWHSYPRN